MRLDQIAAEARAALAAGGADAALAALATHRDELTAERFAYIQAPFAFCAFRLDDCFDGLHMRPHFDRTFAPALGLPFWDGKPRGGASMLWAPHGLGIGAELMHFGFLEGLADRADFEIVCDARLVPLLQGRYPAMTFHGRSAFTPEAAARFGAQATILSLGKMARETSGSYRRARRVLGASSRRVAEVRARYQGACGGRLLVGVSWKTANDSAGSKDYDATPWLTGRGDVQAVSLQHGLSAPEVERKAAAGVHFDPLIDPEADIDGLVHQIAAMDAVVTCSTSVAHFAGSLGKRTYLVLNAVPPWQWWPKQAESFWYPAIRFLPVADDAAVERSRATLDRYLSEIMPGVASTDARPNRRDSASMPRR